MRYTLLGLLLGGLLSGCATSSLVRPDFQLPGAKEMAFASPVSMIAVARYNQPGVVNPEATAQSAHLMHNLLIRHRSELHLRSEVAFPDSLLQEARREIYRAIEGIEQHKLLAGGANLPVLDYLLNSENQRYILITAASGFTRVPRLGRPVLAYARSSRLPYTSAPSTPWAISRSKSNIFLFIYDSQQKAIVYYTRTPPLAECEPLEGASVEKQFTRLLKKDFRPSSAPD